MTSTTFFSNRLIQMTKKSQPIISNYLSMSSSTNINLKQILGVKIQEHNKKVKEFRGKYGSKIIQEINVDMVYGGMRSVKGMVTETSVLDAEEGIRFRGYTIPDCQKLLPKAKNGTEPLPEGVWWLLCTGDIPNQQQVEAVSLEWANRSSVPGHVLEMLNNFPKHMHPMAQLAAACSALSTESKFAEAHGKGIHKSEYWKYTYEDSMDLLAKLPTVAAIIYKNVYKNNEAVGKVDSKKDWSANFAAQLGYDNELFNELMRLYLVIHADHEGGNASAHASHLVNSTLADPYLSYSAGITALAGPLHGLANQETLIFLYKIVKDLGFDYTEENLSKWLKEHLKSGQVIPGYGHAVLRKTDARYTCEREFALKHLPNDKLFKLVSTLYKVVPDILLEQGKAKNVFPNVDAHSGVLLQHFGLSEMKYYTVLFAVSRAMGCLSSMIWSRGMGLPLERPKSHSTEGLMQLVKSKL
uniref:Citrate synthase n=1 Tax=Rhabditophanes sp. KR3021 TaxID=114890 RepID=A0AC35U234_9BILA